MSKYSIINFIILITIVKKIISQSQKCPLSISQNLDESLNEINNIYIDEKTISIPFQENSPSPFISPELRNSDIFYVTEKKDLNKQNFPSIGINVEATNLTVAKPVFKINNMQVGNENITQTNSLEIEYNCEKNIMGETIIKLSFTPENCNSFQLIWIKKCVGELYGKNPNINLEINLKDNPVKTINNGLIDQNYYYLFNPIDFENQDKEINIYNNDLIISIQKSNSSDDINLLPIEIHPIKNDIINFKILGDLGNKGGKIEEEKKNINIAFECNMTNSQVEYSNNYDIVLPFNDGRKITIYFKKFCIIPTIPIYQKIFYYFYYYTVGYMAFVIIFCVFLYFLSSDEDYGFKDFIFSLKQKIINPLLEYCNISYTSSPSNSDDKDEKSNLKSDETPMENGDEEDLLNIKYTIDKKNENEDYGGI
jgi:hypothetical protein